MNIEQARFNMIEQQIRPWDVLDGEILESLALVKREQFVPPAYSDLAFADVEIPLTIDDAGDGSRIDGEERFDVIILSGSVAQDPDAMLARLNEGGRLFAVVGEAPTMHGRIYTRVGKGCTSIDLFETVAPRLQGFPPGKRFKF